jgi:pilus assembly protein Flp/PilA
MRNIVKRLWLEEEGQDLIEYGLLLALISLAAIASLKTISSAIVNIFSNAAANITSS